MSTTIPMEEVQANLKQLIHQLPPGEEIVITENQLPVAKLVSGSPKKRKPRQAGNCVGMIEIVSDDDEHLTVFKDSM